MKKYCTQDGDCANCSLSSYGKDCRGMPIITRSARINVRVTEELKNKMAYLTKFHKISQADLIEMLIDKEHDCYKLNTTIGVIKNV